MSQALEKAAQQKFPPGMTLGDYVIEQLCAPPTKNSFVYTAHSTRNSGKYVFKYIRPDTVGSQSELIQGEMRANATLAVCEYLVIGFDYVKLDVGQPSETVGYFMDYYTRGDLLEFIIDNSLPEYAVAEMAFRVLRALRNMHAIGWAHRDVKLENIFLTGDGDIPDAYLGDLGYARERDVESGEMFDHAVGSLPNCAPELLEGRPYDEKVDMWAFGVTLFAMLTQQMPFTNPDEDRYAFQEQVLAGDWDREPFDARGCSETARDLIEHLLTVNPHERFSSEDALGHPFFQSVTNLMTSTKQATSMLDVALSVMDGGDNDDFGF